MRLGIARPVSLLAAAIATVLVPASPAWAESHDLDVTLVYRLASLQQVGDQLLIEAEGGGVSRLLGRLTATASVLQDVIPDPCFHYSAEFDLSAEEGTIRIHSEGTVCPAPTLITGSWEVTGGTGAFAGATGSGTESGKYSFTGLDPVIDRLRGTISY